MSRIVYLVLCISLLSLNPQRATAQEKPTVEITTVRQKADIVRFSLTSSKPFIFGNNTYALYIGSKAFTRTEQWKHKGRGFITFLIPSDEAKDLQEGANIYLTYGEVNIDEQDMTELAAKSRRCWALGKYYKGLWQK